MGRSRTLELTGEIFNDVLVLNRDPKDVRYWECLCPCGEVFRTTPQRLRSGRCKSCGCMTSKFLSEAHKAWQKAKIKCFEDLLSEGGLGYKLEQGLNRVLEKLKCELSCSQVTTHY